MDKRLPSSFQQLEKLGEGTYATVSTWLVTSDRAPLTPTLGIQGPQSTDGRVCRAQRDSPRLRGRNAFDRDSRDIAHERAEAREHRLPTRCDPHRK